MSVSTVPSRRTVVLVSLVLVALLAWSAWRSGSEAASPVAPARAGSAQAGKVVLDSLPGAVKASLPVRTFAAGGVNTSTFAGGGAGTGKFVPDDPALVVDATDVDPLLLRAVATGVHLQKVTVTLFRPGTHDKEQVWEFADTILSEMRTAQSGSARAPRVSLGLRYTRVTLTTYDADGGVARTFCFALNTSTAC